MLTFEKTIRINRPVAEVFAFLADCENLPKWNYYVTQDILLLAGAEDHYVPR